MSCLGAPPCEQALQALTCFPPACFPLPFTQLSEILANFLPAQVTLETDGRKGPGTRPRASDNGGWGWEKALPQSPDGRVTPPPSCKQEGWRQAPRGARPAQLSQPLSPFTAPHTSQSPSVSQYPHNPSYPSHFSHPLTALHIPHFPHTPEPDMAVPGPALVPHCSGTVVAVWGPLGHLFPFPPKSLMFSPMGPPWAQLVGVVRSAVALPPGPMPHPHAPTGASCEVVLAPCTPDPCKNSGKCQESEDYESFSCMCPAGWQGKVPGLEGSWGSPA